MTMKIFFVHSFTHSFNQLINEWINQLIVLFLSRGLKLIHQRVLASHKASVSSQVLIKSLSYQDQCVFSSCIVWTQTRNSTVKRFVFHRHCKHSIKLSNQRSMHAPPQRTLSFYSGLFTDPLFSLQSPSSARDKKWNPEGIHWPPSIKKTSD